MFLFFFNLLSFAFVTPIVSFYQENIDQFGGDPKSVTLMGHGTLWSFFPLSSECQLVVHQSKCHFHFLVAGEPRQLLVPPCNPHVRLEPGHLCSSPRPNDSGQHMHMVGTIKSISFKHYQHYLLYKYKYKYKQLPKVIII